MEGGSDIRKRYISSRGSDRLAYRRRGQKKRQAALNSTMDANGECLSHQGMAYCVQWFRLKNPRICIIHFREGFHQKCSVPNLRRVHFSDLEILRRASVTVVMWAEGGLTAKSVMFCSWSYLWIFGAGLWESGWDGRDDSNMVLKKTHWWKRFIFSTESLFFPSVIDEHGINCALSYLMTLVTKIVFNFAFYSNYNSSFWISLWALSIKAVSQSTVKLKQKRQVPKSMHSIHCAFIRFVGDGRWLDMMADMINIMRGNV